jgi:hypothetical protein
MSHCVIHKQRDHHFKENERDLKILDRIQKKKLHIDNKTSVLQIFFFSYTLGRFPFSQLSTFTQNFFNILNNKHFETNQ